MARPALLVLAALAPLASSQPALAQESWPNKPIRILVPFAPGGVTDTVTRINAPRLQEALGQPVLVENRPGAGGAVATEAVAKSAPDGYTLLMGSAAPQTLLQYLQKTGYDGVTSFAPISPVNTNPLVLAVNPSLPVKSVRELIDAAKAQPGKLNFGGAGGLTQFSGEIFKHMAGVNIIYVAYKGGAPATAAAVAGDVQVTFANYSDALPQMKAGKLRALGITGSRRFPQSPDVPTIAEAGIPGYAVDSWNGLFAPAGTPAAVVNRISSIVQQGAKDPVVRQRMFDIGSEAFADTPEGFRTFLLGEQKRWSEFVKQSGIKIEQ